MRITPFGIEQFLPVRDQKTKLECNLKLLIWEIYNCTVKTIFTSEELLFKWWTKLPVSLNKIKELHPTGRITRDTPSLTGKFAKPYKIPLTKWFFCFHVYFANYYGESGKSETRDNLTMSRIYDRMISGEFRSLSELWRISQDYQV